MIEMAIFIMYWIVVYSYNMIISPASMRFKVGYIGFTLSVHLSIGPSVHPSVCGQNNVCFVSATILAKSISYLDILLAKLRKCVICWEFWKFQNFIFWQYLSMYNFDLVLYACNMIVKVYSWSELYCLHFEFFMMIPLEGSSDIKFWVWPKFYCWQFL